MKIGVTTTDGKTYVLIDRYESVIDAIEYMQRIYSSPSFRGTNHFAYLICENGICIFVNKIVSVFQVE